MGFFKKLASFFKEYKVIDVAFYNDLEELLVMGDVGIEASEELIEELKSTIKRKLIIDADEAMEVLKEMILEKMSSGRDGHEYDFEDEKSVILIVGINGVGKTTTIGKLAHLYKGKGKKVLLAAADTFRAAAIDQLDIWAERAGVDIIKGREGGDPGAVIFDAMKASTARDTDILLCDTAGRLHNKTNLMNELKKLNTIIESENKGIRKETFVVVDAMTGQNALNQAREFKEVTNVTGLILTKLDSSAKGGIAITIQKELGIPVKYIGVGEGIEDLKRFEPEEFIKGVLG